jgi:caffeoyl-CoA O-methyltransferase
VEYVPPRLEEYAERFTTVHADVFDRLHDETSALPNAAMSVGPLEGAFLSFMVTLKQPRLVLEIGTFTGWSSIAMALALPAGGRLISCDVNPDTTAIARRYAEEAGVADRIEYIVGDARETVAGLDGPFDLIFVDALKAQYVEYYEAVLPKLADGGVLMADNTLFGLADGEIAEHMTRFNEHVRRDDRVECTLVTIREGVTLIRRRRPAAS